MKSEDLINECSGCSCGEECSCNGDCQCDGQCHCSCCEHEADEVDLYVSRYSGIPIVELDEEDFNDWD